MPNKKPKLAKRIYLVNRDLQLRYAKGAVLVGFLSTVLTAVLILYPLFAFEVLRLPRFLPLPILFLMAFAALVNILLICGLSILLTHRLAGPLYSLVRGFRQVALGAFAGGLQVRADDELKFVVRNFNAMVASLCLLTEQEAQSLGASLQALEKAQLPQDEQVYKAIQGLQTLHLAMMARCHTRSKLD